MKGKKKHFHEQINSILHAMVANIICYSAFVFFIFICRGKVKNEENVLRNLQDGFVIASNHVSYLDSLVLYAYFHFRYRIRLLFIAKNKLFKHPLWNLVARGARVVRVSDSGTKIMSIRDFRRLAEAKYIGIFPEGTRSETGKLITPHGGAIKLAARNNIPLIPLRLEGFYEAWPRKKNGRDLIPVESS
jgi:1-acyl-sn-glycerol-3-phosphate acyltransferase